MADDHCAKCGLRARHDKNPTSLIGRLWRWHINFCPGWKRYVLSLSAEEKAKVVAQYNFRKYS